MVDSAQRERMCSADLVQFMNQMFRITIECEVCTREMRAEGCKCITNVFRFHDCHDVKETLVQVLS